LTDLKSKKAKDIESLYEFDIGTKARSMHTMLAKAVECMGGGHNG
jgi:hypothetical protein